MFLNQITFDITFFDVDAASKWNVTMEKLLFHTKINGTCFDRKNINDYHCMYQSTLNVVFKPLLINTHIHVLLFWFYFR